MRSTCNENAVERNRSKFCYIIYYGDCVEKVNFSLWGLRRFLTFFRIVDEAKVRKINQIFEFFYLELITLQINAFIRYRQNNRKIGEVFCVFGAGY